MAAGGSPGPRQWPLSNMIAIKFGQKGVWCSVQIFLGNEGEGGGCNLRYAQNHSNFSDPHVPLPSLGTDGVGNPSFWHLRTDGPIVPAEVFNTKTTLDDGTVIQNFGLEGFDGGDAHNGSIFYFKVLKPARKTFDVAAFVIAGVHSDPMANIYQESDFQLPWSFSEPHTVLATNTFVAHTGRANFHFNVTKDAEHIDADGD